MGIPLYQAMIWHFTKNKCRSNVSQNALELDFEKKKKE